MRLRAAAAAVATATALVAALAGCGHAHKPLPAPLLFGSGPRYHPPPYGPSVAAARPVGSLRCSTPPRPTRFLAHVEVIARGRVALVPAGIGIAPPHVRRGAYVARGRCEYPLRTREPTGLIEVALANAPTLGAFFRVWGQPLAQRRLLGFRARRGQRLIAFVGERRWSGDPAAIPLRRHVAVTLELGRLVPPRPRYAFPPGP